MTKYRPIPFPVPPRIALEFWKRVRKPRGKGCWLWAPEGKPARHRATFYHADEGAIFIAARVAWTLVNGPIPKGVQVLHRCDNEACVYADKDPKKSHLFLGSGRDNMLDASLKTRLFRKRKDPRMTVVTCRFFSEDIAVLKAEAEAAGEIGWQQRLRKLIHDAVRSKKEIR